MFSRIMCLVLLVAVVGGCSLSFKLQGTPYEIKCSGVQEVKLEEKK